MKMIVGDRGAKFLFTKNEKRRLGDVARHGTRNGGQDEYETVVQQG